jgi:hypothetical protein
MRRFLFALLLPIAACGSSPSSPSEAGASGILSGQAVSAMDGAPLAGVTVQIGASGRRATTDANGMFEMDMGRAGAYATLLRSGAVVERETMADAGADRVRLSLIPSTFDLEAFDQMFRTSHARLQRWTTRPSLVVLASVMEYRGVDDEYSATAEQLSDDEVSQMVAHMTEGLALLTGGTYTSFAAVQIERPAEGTRSRVGRENQIVVGRYNGIVTWARTIGYGSWAEQPDGHITAGSMYLDRDFDRNDTRRRLLRIHELGHALGYQHVTARTSVMNPTIGPEPTDFDRAGAVIAFQRPTGNKSPDIDPASLPRTFSTDGGGSTWTTIFCR